VQATADGLISGSQMFVPITAMLSEREESFSILEAQFLMLNPG
jgi:hypothetical protein